MPPAAGHNECPSLPLTQLKPLSPPMFPTVPPQVLRAHPQGPALPLCSPTSSLAPAEPREGLITISWTAGSAPCSLHSWAGALGTKQQRWGAAPTLSPFMTPSPRWLLPPQWFIGVGARSPQECGKHRGGATEGPPEPEPRLLRQGLISSLTKAAMQYWRATGNPKLQYLRAARALLTALHSLQTPPLCPKHRARVPWPILCQGKD